MCRVGLISQNIQSHIIWAAQGLSPNLDSSEFVTEGENVREFIRAEKLVQGVPHLIQQEPKDSGTQCTSLP